MYMSDRVYDTLKWVALIVLPALATLIITLGETWGIVYAPQIGATITAVSAFIGACIQVSNSNYKKANRGEE